MRKFLSLFLATLMLASLFTVTGAAEENSFRPEFVISKLSPNPAWPEGGNPVEAIELLNTSGRDLNLYDYSLFYNGSSTAKKAGKIIRVAPLKGGDFRDGTTYTYEAMRPNPDECIVKPGEIVIIWVIFSENVEKFPTLTEADFRAFWNIPESVRVICFDGVATSPTNTHFNLKNGDTAVYGIIRNDITVVSGESSCDEGESYSSVTFSDTHPCLSNGILVYGFDGAHQMTEIEYSAEGIQLGVLTDAQKASLADLLPAEEAPVEETAAAETPAAETPAAETPAAETPAAETPAAETPAAPSTPSVPPTGDNGVFFFAAAFMLAAGGFYVCRKKRVEG